MSHSTITVRSIWQFHDKIHSVFYLHYLKTQKRKLMLKIIFVFIIRTKKVFPEKNIVKCFIQNLEQLIILEYLPVFCITIAMNIFKIIYFNIIFLKPHIYISQKLDIFVIWIYKYFIFSFYVVFVNKFFLGQQKSQISCWLI